MLLSIFAKDLKPTIRI